jgi:hypothetical protein
VIRRFQPGTNLLFGYVVYNSQNDKNRPPPALYSQASLWHDGNPVYTGPSKPINISGQNDLERINVGGGILLGTALGSGEYVLKITVMDPLAREPYRKATQLIEFEVVR